MQDSFKKPMSSVFIYPTSHAVANFSAGIRRSWTIWESSRGKIPKVKSPGPAAPMKPV
jgi:hypothetical protein